MKISNDAQIVIVKKEAQRFMFLVLRRLDKEKQKTHFRLVKGGLKNGETPEQAARREALEEANIDLFTSINFLCHYNYLGGEVKHEVDVFLAIVDPSTVVSVDSSDEGGYTIYNGVWMTSDEAIQNLTFKEERELVKQALQKI